MYCCIVLWEDLAISYFEWDDVATDYLVKDKIAAMYLVPWEDVEIICLVWEYVSTSCLVWEDVEISNFAWNIVSTIQLLCVRVCSKPISCLPTLSVSNTAKYPLMYNLNNQCHFKVIHVLLNWGSDIFQSR